MSDRDLMQIFDAALPRLELYGRGSVPPAGAVEAVQHEQRQESGRTELAMYSAATGAFGLMAWIFWGPWLPLWFMVTMCAPVAAAGFGAARAFLRLAFGQRLEQALPPGTDKTTVQLEDGTWSLIRSWNADAFAWNRRVEALRSEVSDWQFRRDVPEARGIEWSERFSMTRAEALIAEMQGLAAERAALAARRTEIQHRLRSLEARMLQLQAEESPTLALPAPDEDPADDG